MLAFFDKVFKREEEEVNIEEVLNSLDVEEETMYEDVDAFVKKMDLLNPEDVDRVIAEAKAGNVIILDIESLSKRNVIRLKEYIEKIKAAINEIDGDIGRITPTKILITPSKVKIMRKKQK